MSSTKRKVIGLLGCVPGGLAIGLTSQALGASEVGFYLLGALGVVTYNLVMVPWMMEGQFIWQLLKRNEDK